MSFVMPKLGPNDIHVVVSGINKKAQGYDAAGKKIFEIDALCDGVNGGHAYGNAPNWNIHAGDTVPGCYFVSAVDYPIREIPYGLIYFYLTSLDGNEQRAGRDGEGWHCGGSALEDPFALDQPLVCTEGCVRSHAGDLINIILPLFKKVQNARGRFYFTVTWE